MSTSRASKPILLLGAYGRGNAGDDVFIIAALQLFKDRTIYMNAADDSLLPPRARTSGIQTLSTVSGRDLFKKISVFLQVRHVVYWGGDLWVELYGAPRPRQLLYNMVFLNCLLRLAGKRIYYIGCGIGDLQGFSLWLARLSARMARAVTVRERRSAQILRLKQVSVLPDLAITLPYHRPAMHQRSATRPFSVVISVMHSLPDAEQTFPRLLRSIADLVNSLPPERFQVTVLPMHMSGTDVFDDLRASEALLQHITVPIQLADTRRSLRATVKLLSGSHLVIGTRLHANILAIMNATPAIGIAYRPKVRSFFTDNQLDGYVLALDQLQQLGGLFHQIIDNYEAVAEQFYRVSNRNLSQRTAYAKLISNL
ncbi:MAG TPA: polysaccharide pyruvyl transferase family protein [Candidatus Saccharimonadales bacterium]|nr:polysaccharide pyruvyl transferase family protein [Candidatus Saccharimonadales bacterium]